MLDHSMCRNLDKFADYVWSFYGEHCDTIYPIKGLTIEDVFHAIEIYIERLELPQDEKYAHYAWGEGDSLDRERVRDIILEQPQFTWSS